MNSETSLLVDDNPSDIGLTRRPLAKSRVTNELVVAGHGHDAPDLLFGVAACTARDVIRASMLVRPDLPALMAGQDNPFGGLAPQSGRLPCPRPLS